MTTKSSLRLGDTFWTRLWRLAVSVPALPMVRAVAVSIPRTEGDQNFDFWYKERLASHLLACFSRPTALFGSALLFWLPLCFHCIGLFCSCFALFCNLLIQDRYLHELVTTRHSESTFTFLNPPDRRIFPLTTSTRCAESKKEKKKEREGLCFRLPVSLVWFGGPVPAHHCRRPQLVFISNASSATITGDESSPHRAVYRAHSPRE